MTSQDSTNSADETDALLATVTGTNTSISAPIAILPASQINSANTLVNAGPILSTASSVRYSRSASNAVVGVQNTGAPGTTTPGGITFVVASRQPGQSSTNQMAILNHTESSASLRSRGTLVPSFNPADEIDVWKENS